MDNVQSKVRRTDTNQILFPVAVGGVFLVVLLVGALIG